MNHSQCPYLKRRFIGDEVYYHCEMNDMSLCVVEYTNETCELWEEVKAEWESECPECGEERPDDDRVKNGLKCAECAYKGG